MRLYLYLFTCTIALACTAGGTTHLDIRCSSLDSGFLNGPIKTITEVYDYEMSDRKYREIREYDEAGNLLHREKYDYKDRLTYAATNFYDEAGCQIRQIVNDVKNEERYDYDIVLSPATHQIAYKCRLTGEIEVVTYNEEGFQMKASVKKKKKKNLPMSSYKRRSDNRSTGYTRYDDDGRVKYVSSYKRDDLGRLQASVVTYKREKRKSMYQYEYLNADDHGNWTQRLMKTTYLRDGEEKKYDKFSERTIEYYRETGETGETVGDTGEL